MTVKVDIEPNGKENLIRVTFDFSMSRVQAVKTVAGAKFVPEEKGGPHWTVKLDIDNCRQLRKLFENELKVGKPLKDWATKEIKHTTEMITLATADDADLEILPDLLPEMYAFIASRPYQKADIKFMATNPGPANCNQPGLGKTIETIASVFESGQHEGSHLIAAPVTSLDVVWEYELGRFGQPYEVLVASGGRDGRQAVLDRAVKLHRQQEPFWLVINPAMIQYRREFAKCSDHAKKRGVRVREMQECPECEEHLIPAFPELLLFDWKTLILDEFHKCGLTNTSTLTSKAMRAVKSEKKIALSGTPMGGKPIKLFGMLQFLRPEIFTSKWNFADQWLHVTSNGYGKDIGGIREEKQEAFFEMLGRHVLRRTKEEVLLQLPPKQYIEIDVPLDEDSEQGKQYREFESAAFIKIEEQELSATSILAEYTRLKQFANAAQDISVKQRVRKDGEEVDQIMLHPRLGLSNKLPHVEEIMNERGIDPAEMEGEEQVVIFSQFSQTVDMVHEYLVGKKYPVAKLTGDTKTKDRSQMVRDFQSEDSPLRVLVMTTTAGGVSITLDRASTVIFLDETWVPDDQEQAEDRCHRGSRNHQVTVFKIRSKGTIEQDIAQTTGEKQDMNDLVLDLRRLAKQKKES